MNVTIEFSDTHRVEATARAYGLDRSVGMFVVTLEPLPLPAVLQRYEPFEVGGLRWSRYLLPNTAVISEIPPDIDWVEFSAGRLNYGTNEGKSLAFIP